MTPDQDRTENQQPQDQPPEHQKPEPIAPESEAAARPDPEPAPEAEPVSSQPDSAPEPEAAPEPDAPASKPTPAAQPEASAPQEPDPDAEVDPEAQQKAPEDEEFDALLDDYLPGSQPQRGEVTEMAVVAIREDSVLIDIGGKAEASIPISEFPLTDGKPTVAVGDMIPVVQSGRRYSHRQARMREAQKAIREAMENHQAVTGVVRDTVKGGLMVDIGLDAFMPASQVDLFKIPDLKEFVGKEVEAYVLEFDSRRQRAVLSRRELLVERRDNERKTFLEEIGAKDTVVGAVKSCLDFGVFINLGAVDGFVPREEVSWDRGKAPGEILEPGVELEFKVVSVNVEEGKITLSRKRLTPNPWEDAENRYPAGSAIKGKVVTVEKYGAFVQLEEGLTGMIHASDMSWATGNKKPEDYVREGDEITAQVLEVNKDKRRISLGLKQLTADPWADVHERFPAKSRHKGVVTSLTNYGAFVKLDDYLEGMVHVGDISWEKRVNHPKDHLKVGEEVDVMVLKVDKEKHRISLGIKQLTDSPYDAFLKEHPVGTLVEGTVARFAPFGAFVQLTPSLEGLIHISQIDTKRVELPENALEIGQQLQVKIIGAEKKNQKISLSRKEAIKQQEKDQIRTYMKKQDENPGGMSFGEALRDAKKKKKKSGE